LAVPPSSAQRWSWLRAPVLSSPPALPILTLGAIAVEGGLPLMEGGKVIGAIGCSDGTGAQDSQACQAGTDTIK
jgi:uncharacterized protein GlcG (DUF336 family)